MSRRLPPGSGVVAVRHGTGVCCSFDSSVSVTRSATPRAVVNFVPATRQQPLEALRRVIADLLVSFERDLIAVDGRGHDAAVDERHVGQRQIERRETPGSARR